MNDMQLQQALREIVGAHGLRSGASVQLLDPGYHPHNLQAGLWVEPGDTAQVAAVLRLCHATGRSVVPQGGLTGVVGGAVSQPGEVLLSLRRMQRIVMFDADSAIVQVEAGIPLQQLQNAIASDGLCLGTDLASRASATLGGLLATNAGGIRAFQLGMMRQQVLGLEVVLADGTVYSELSTVLKNNTGYDVKQLFIGSEGTLGVITQAVLRLEVSPQVGATALLGLHSMHQVLIIAKWLRRQYRAQLLACEILWHDYLAGVRALHPAAAALQLTESPLYLLVELANDPCFDVAASFEHALSQYFENAVLKDAVLAKTEAQRQLIWLLREDSDGLLRHARYHMSLDVSLPLHAIDEYTHSVLTRFAIFDPQIRVYLFGHLLDGNLHIMLAAEAPLEPRRSEIERLLYQPLAGFHAAFSAEHGIGIEKKAALKHYGNATKLQLMYQLKHLLDPTGILNRGKVVDAA